MTDPKDFHCHGENCLGEISVDDFLNQYWQKKPLLIRNAFTDIQPPLSADELAGLACEEYVNARLVLEKGDKNTKPWRIEFGPFKESRFNDLPESHWSLLVSDVEKHLPETKALLKLFRFIPDWRVDDLMISYAPPGGSVGAHTDAYDVFLIQLSGQRLWKISEHFPEETLEDVDLCILKNFTAEQEWLLNAGDMLYLPPNVAHHGIAQACVDVQGKNQPCLTASIGFRAPSLKTISSEYIHFINENRATEVRYRDASPVKPSHHAEISEETITHFIDYLKQGLTLERDQVKQWLGEYSSDNNAFENLVEDLPENQQDMSYDEFHTIAARSELRQSPYSHFLFSYSKQAALLFVNGNSYRVSKRFAESICENESIDFTLLQQIMETDDIETDEMEADDKKVLLTLFKVGAIIAV